MWGWDRLAGRSRSAANAASRGLPARSVESQRHSACRRVGDGCRFIPFRDGTSGDTTCAGGRYVGIEVPEDGSAVIDFNRASNPWCVYDEEFSCPAPPPENAITEPVEAGEKLWRPPD